MDVEYLKSNLQTMETKVLVRMIYFDKASYAEEAINEAIAELKRRGQYKAETLSPIAKEVRDEISDRKRLIQEVLSKPPSKGSIFVMLVAPAILAMIQYFFPNYNLTPANVILVLLLVRLARKHYWKYLGLGLLINGLVFSALVFLLR
ncbi:MAG: hypothetical protein WAN11_26570 [Syntrophobacteraceae bacterium]